MRIKVTHTTTDPDEGAAEGIRGCNRFFDGKPYSVDINLEPTRDKQGQVLGYRVDIEATDDVRTTPLDPIEAEVWYGRRPEDA